MKLLDILLSPIRNNPRFYLALMFLFTISIIPIEYGRCSRMRAGLEMFGDIYLLCALITPLPAKFRRWVKYAFFGLFYIVGLVDMMCYQTMGVALIPNVLQTWLQTNMQEASEALSLHLTPSLLLTPVSLFLVLPFLLYALRNILRLQRRAIITLLVLSLVAVVYGINNKRYLWHVYTRVSDDDMKEECDVESMTHEYLPIYRLGLCMKEIRRFSKMRHHLLRNVRTTEIDSCSFDSPLIVLIIGESYNRHHSSLYGYPLPTAPYQKRMYEEGSLYRFNDVIASYNLTFKSFQNMLTLYNYDSRGQWYDYPILPAIFKKAGYKVSFFSNQNTLDKASAFTDFSEDMFMNNPDISSYMFDVRNEKSHRYDMQLTDDYLTLTDTASVSPQLVIFHFLGVHVDFKLRYPEEQTLFSASDYHRPDLTAEEKETLAHYDNAILYNDKVIEAIIALFRSKDAILIYVPDHGELVYDDCQEMGRNMLTQRKYVIPQYDIPFWIYCTKQYKENHPEICRLIERAVDRPFMTDDLPHLLLFLSGIKCKGFQHQRNLIDEQYNDNRKRMIKGECDYDL